MLDSSRGSPPDVADSALVLSNNGRYDTIASNSACTN